MQRRPPFSNASGASEACAGGGTSQTTGSVEGRPRGRREFTQTLVDGEREDVVLERRKRQQPVEVRVDLRGARDPAECEVAQPQLLHRELGALERLRQPTLIGVE